MRPLALALIPLAGLLAWRLARSRIAVAGGASSGAQLATSHGADEGDSAFALVLPVTPAPQAQPTPPVPLNAPRGIRNHNPGNIRRRPDIEWQGQADEQPDPAFVTFVEPLYGLRALARVLLNYQRKHGLRTVRGIISRWAPPTENNTGAYITSVSAALGVGPDDMLDLYAARLEPLMRAIVKHENGAQWADHYPAGLYAQAAALARA